MSTNHSPVTADPVKPTDATPAPPAQEASPAEKINAAVSVNNDAAAQSADAQAASVPVVPPGPDLDPDLERMLLGFCAEPANYPDLNNGAADLPRGVSVMLASLSEWAHRLAGSGVELESLEGRPREILKAIGFFVQRALLAPRGSHYRVLGLNATASASEIHDHYRYLRRLFSVTDPEGSAHAAVMRVSEAYVVLRDPARRRAYDASVFGSGALPRLEAERRGSAGGKQRIAAVGEPGRVRRWLSIGAAFVVVLGIFWSLGGFDEPTVETSTALAPTTDPAVPESVTSSTENIPAPSGDSTPSETPPETTTSEAEPSPSVDPSAESSAAAADKALLERVDDFAGDGAPRDEVTQVPSVAAAPSQQVEPPADPPVAESEPSSVPVEPAPAETATTSAAPSTQTASSEPASTEKTSAEPPAGVEEKPTSPTEASTTTAGPEVAVVPVVPAAPAIPSEPPVEAEVEKLLARAERQVRDGQLTTPEGNSAVDTYKKVLGLDPGNTRAAQGMSAIADRYAMLARYRLRRDELAEARTMAERGLELAPAHAPLLAARSAIEARAAALAAPQTPTPTIPSSGDAPTATASGASVPLASAPALSSGGSTATVQPSRPSPGTPTQPGPIASVPTQPVPITSRPAQSANTPLGPPSSTAAAPPAGSTPTFAATPPPLPAAAPAMPLPPAAPPVQDAPIAESSAGTAVATEQPQQPAPTVASVAPPPAASATPPVAPPTTSADEALSEQALNTLVNKFVEYYEGGDIESFMALFAPDSETNSRKGAKGIRQDYTSLFAGSQSRLMRLKDLRWNRSAGEAVGEADFSLSLFGRRESRPNAYEGRLTFRVVERNGEPVIKGLFHSQRKLDDG